jgi:hypothetical protein
METMIFSCDIEKATKVRFEVNQQEVTEINNNENGTATIVFQNRYDHDAFWKKAAGRNIAIV